MSYKKDLQKFQEKVVSREEIVGFVLGKGHLRLPNKDELSDLLVGIGDENMEAATGDELPIEIPEKYADKKALMDELIVRIKSFPLTKDNLITLWKLAHDRRKRKMLIAALVAGSIIVAGGVTLGIIALINRNKEKDMQDTSNVNDDASDIEVYSEDIPQVDIDSDTEV